MSGLRSSVRTIHWFGIAAFGWSVVGCSDSGSGGSRSAPTVYVDPAMNGAARNDPNQPRRSTLAVSERKLVFVAQATGRRPASGTEQERKLAASQAAIIDALGDAVAESRRLAGQSTDDFTCELGPRVTIMRRGGNAGDTELRVTGSGGARTLRTRDGVLQHRPSDLATIQRVLQATDGQYALLSVEQSGGSEECVASVARYESGATAFARGASGGDSQ